MSSNTTEIEMLSLPSPSVVVPDATRNAAGRIRAMAAIVSMVACERAAAALKCCSDRRIPPANIAAPRTRRILPIIDPANTISISE